jgi:acyl carrier protein
MTEKEIFQELIEILKNSMVDASYDFDSITMDSKLYDELGITSISAIYMALEIESRFHFAITNEEAAKLVKVKDLVDLIKGKNQ